MSVLRITNGFTRLSDENLLGRAGEINLAMVAASGTFPTPTPTLATLQTAISDFSIALAKAKSGSELDKSIKNDRRQELINLLHALGNYVVFTVNGDRTKAVSSGFSIAKEPAPLPPIGKPENLQVTEGPNAGELNIKFNRVIGARSYMVQYAEETSSSPLVWQSQTCTTSKFILKPLQSGKKYQLRVVAVGTNQQLMYSDPVSKLVQ
jgi:hypothetical protein